MGQDFELSVGIERTWWGGGLFYYNQGCDKGLDKGKGYEQTLVIFQVETVLKK